VKFCADALDSSCLVGCGRSTAPAPAFIFIAEFLRHYYVYHALQMYQMSSVRWYAHRLRALVIYLYDRAVVVYVNLPRHSSINDRLQRKTSKERETWRRRALRSDTRTSTASSWYARASNISPTNTWISTKHPSSTYQSFVTCAPRPAEEVALLVARMLVDEVYQDFPGLVVGVEEGSFAMMAPQLRLKV